MLIHDSKVALNRPIDKADLNKYELHAHNQINLMTKHYLNASNVVANFGLTYKPVNNRRTLDSMNVEIHENKVSNK